MELVASRDERYVAIRVYSGQSSEGFEVFVTEPTLTRVGGLAEVRGHGAAPIFAPSSRWLATLISSEQRVRGSGEYFETVQDEYANDRLIVDWARLHVQRLPEATLYSAEVGVEIPRSTPLDLLDAWTTYDALRFVGEGLTLRMPWSEEVSVALPPTAPITCHGFTT
jgi:hypothetical protein